MKLLIFVLFSFLAVGCSTITYVTEWQIDPNNKQELDKFWANNSECKDFAYRSKVAGSKYAEADIHYSCLQRKGYTFKVIEKRG